MRLSDANDQMRRAPVRALRAVFSGVGQLLLAADRLREEDARGERESGDAQHDALTTWEGRLSSSVRLIKPAAIPAPSSRGAGDAPGGKSEPAGRATGSRGRKAEPAGRKVGRSKVVAEPPRFRSLDLTGNVRMLSEQDIEDLAADGLERDVADAQPAGPPGPTKPGTTPQVPASVLAAGTAAPVWSQAAPSWSSWSTSAAQEHEVTPLANLPISGYDELSLPSLRARLRSLDADALADLLEHERSHANRDDVVTMFERRIAKLAADGT